MIKLTQVLKRYSGWTLVLLLAFALFVPGAFAADQYGRSEIVLARVPISGPPVRQMFLSRQNGKHYLYVDQGENPGVTVVDVTNPRDPKIARQNIAWPGDTASGQLEIIGARGNVGISEVRQRQQQPPRPREINILDLTDPSHPHVLQTFKDVTALLPEDGRGLLYVANNEGVWILQHHISQRGWAVQHECNSESAIQAMPPDCY
jgi:hypothetical protein